MDYKEYFYQLAKASTVMPIKVNISSGGQLKGYFLILSLTDNIDNVDLILQSDSLLGGSVTIEMSLPSIEEPQG